MSQNEASRLYLRQRRARPAALFAVVGLCLAGCHGAGRSGDPPAAVLRVASQKGSTKAMVVASHVLDGAPYRVEWSEFPSAQALLEAVGANAADLGGAGDAPFLFAYANNRKLRAVQASRYAGDGREVAVMVTQTSPIHAVADLRGRKVATGKGSIGHYLLLQLLARAGIAPAAVHVVFLSPGDAKAALASGSVDAWSTWTPYTSLERLHGGGREIADGRGLLHAYGFEVATEAAITQKRTQIADFVRRLDQAERWSQTHVPEFAAALERETGVPHDVALEVAHVYRPAPLAIDAALVADEQTTLQSYRAAGVIPFAPPVTDAFDGSFNPAG